MNPEGDRFDGALGKVLEDRVLASGDHWARIVTKETMLRVVDLAGKQAVDFLCYNAEDPSERYSAADTMKYAGTIYLAKGHTLYSNLARPLVTIVEDTCGRHDTIGGSCTAENNLFRYGVRDTPNCRDNFLQALAEHGLGKKDIVPNVNFFMNIPVEPDGQMAIAEGFSKPGDFVDLRAEMDVLAVISNCPQTRNFANGYNPTPIRLIVCEPAAGK